MIQKEKEPCPKCGKQNTIKYGGKVKDRQRHHCKDCSYSFRPPTTEIQKKKDQNTQIERKILQLCLEGIPPKMISKYSKGQIENDKINRLFRKIKDSISKYYIKPLRKKESVMDVEDLPSTVLKLMNMNMGKINSGILIIGLDPTTPFSIEINVAEKKVEKGKEPWN